MAQPTAPPLVKFFIAILHGPVVPTILDELLEASWGAIDYRSREYPFDQTNYYEAEMGPGLHRQLVTFTELRSPEDLPEAKLKCNEIELALSPLPAEGEGLGVRRHPKRTINLDIGYLDHNKIVLASVKGLGQKIYLSQGIYADLVARYKHGRYQPFEWTFPDFKEGRYDAELAHIRERYLHQLKTHRREPG